MVRNVADLRLVHMPDADARKILQDRPDLVAEFARIQITTEDVVALAYRREQLKAFSDMLDDVADISESTWQELFERNQWISKAKYCLNAEARKITREETEYARQVA